MSGRILVADDDPEILQMVSLSLELDGYKVDGVPNGERAIQWVKERPAPSLIILDLMMPGIGGMETLRRLRDMPQKTPILVLSCMNSPDMIVEAMQNGASDYVAKPFEDTNLHSHVAKLISGEIRALPTLPISTNQTVGAASREEFLGFVALNPQMLKIHETIQQISHTDVPVLIHGESGVGKEVVARAIHESSDRRSKPFIKINCAALPSTLLESEMFGYERGAFTGAFNSKPGKFEQASSGTIFLDEISEMSPSLQAKFLQVLQDSRFSRLGGKSTIQVDTRVLAATNVNLKQALKDGSFREDLYYRLNVVNVYVPPLRERMDEVPALIAFFMDKYGAQYGRSEMPDGRLLAAIQRYEWPGNVRELENVIRRYLVLGDSDLVAQELEHSTLDSFRKSIHLPGTMQESNAEIPFTERVNDFKRSAETEAISKALGRTNWNRKQAAKLLNISYKSLLYRMKVLGIGGKSVA